ncbi:hypothetical protein XM38_043370 [Halomicronema hongdechloris C2206]|uniref:Uncharacterized protein n=1 Tax=Halomicronema hongdechloris C2206 TaxID=1641165 RepID=A0A1Z3HT00_9CYAN|nr:hypothetical protein XM38_043370 [Halomicronema hongdechloris C2206]
MPIDGDRILAQWPFPEYPGQIQTMLTLPDLVVNQVVEIRAGFWLCVFGKGGIGDQGKALWVLDGLQRKINIEVWPIEMARVGFF